MLSSIYAAPYAPFGVLADFRDQLGLPDMRQEKMRALSEPLALNFGKKGISWTHEKIILVFR